MRQQRKVFRIEAYQKGLSADEGGKKPLESDDLAASRHAEILAAIAKIGSGQPSGANRSKQSNEVTDQILNDYKTQISESNKLKSELQEIHSAISDTKKEIATLHVTGFNGDDMSRVADELDAIVDGTESATEAILTAAENIDQLAATLMASVKAATNKGLVDDIQQDVIRVFEACNFQDLTGQRISKVIKTMRFIEDRIVKMIDIWGGQDSFDGIEAEVVEKATGDAALLNGPSLAKDQDTAEQDDIDAMFD